RAGDAYSYNTGEKMVKYTEEQILELIMTKYIGNKIYLLAPVVRNRKGHYQDLFEQIRKKGYLNVRVDGEIREILPGMRVDRYKNHSIEVLVDKLAVSNKFEDKLKKSLKIAMKLGNGLILIQDMETDEVRHYSKSLMCPSTGLSYSEPAPHNFSFNSPQGACIKCNGLGTVDQIDIDKVFPKPELSIAAGGIAPLGKEKSNLLFWQITAICEKHGVTLKTPIKDIPEDAINDILHGTTERLRINNRSLGNSNYLVAFEGVLRYIDMQQEDEATAAARRWAAQFITKMKCPDCNGKRLNKEALHFKVKDQNIADLAQKDIVNLYNWMEKLSDDVSGKQLLIIEEIKKEILTRLSFLLDVGLSYLSLSRASASLSGGESQRIRLATQIGSQLVNVLYILDEPSIGLHQRDNDRLINSLKKLRDTGNSIIVVEHDKEMMLASDYIVDLGPFAGRKGGEVVYQGTPQKMLAENTLTSNYLNGSLEIKVPEKRRKGNGEFIELKGATGNNLKNVTAKFPLGTFICVTGVSGSGKSTLLNGTLQPILSQHFYNSHKEPLPYKSIKGIDNIDKVISVDQSPIGRTPRSNPATYTGVFTDIRNLFAGMPEAKVRGYKPGRFSFNVKGGRCETCGGNGHKTIEMNFLPDVMVPCETCAGKRYNRETLEVRFKGKSISDVLDMTINAAVDFFENVPSILTKIKMLQEVGLGYIRLGQSSTTLSGGESQRIKLAAELAKRDTGRTLYVLDEPTTGLHFEDIRVLLKVINTIVDRGNTVIIIEHNIDIIKCADYILDLGPEGGEAGGMILTKGTPEEVMKNSKEDTAKYLKREFKENPKSQKSTA
ncbi:MAG: excinuclease ABC subunit UvrA, partial [Bacteroidales bacterium]|nr:excinuclease ABC subunit UvrA [Bacteroidales bacterium]